MAIIVFKMRNTCNLSGKLPDCVALIQFLVRKGRSIYPYPKWSANSKIYCVQALKMFTHDHPLEKKLYMSYVFTK